MRINFSCINKKEIFFLILWLHNYLSMVSRSHLCFVRLQELRDSYYTRALLNNNPLISPTSLREIKFISVHSSTTALQTTSTTFFQPSSTPVQVQTVVEVTTVFVLASPGQLKIILVPLLLPKK